MTRFDRIAVVDWSASCAPPRLRPQADAIWIGVASDSGVVTTYHPSRHAAELVIIALIDDCLRCNHRLLLGFDFPMGYPDGFAARLTGHATAAAVWKWLGQHITDGPDNRNNRFAVANQINQMFCRPDPACGTFAATTLATLSGPANDTPAVLACSTPHHPPSDRATGAPSGHTSVSASGPFWGRPESQPFPHLPSRKTANYAALNLSERRRVEQLVPRAQPVWKLYTTGAAGGQSLTGLPLIHRLSQRPSVSVWPFEPEAQITLAEIYPSLIAPAVTAAMSTAALSPSVTAAMSTAALSPSAISPVAISADAISADAISPAAISPAAIFLGAMPPGALSPVAMPPTPIKDEVQVRLLAHALWNLNTAVLTQMLADPPPEARAQEGWILGAGHAATLLAAL